MLIWVLYKVRRGLKTKAFVQGNKNGAKSGEAIRENIRWVLLG